mmetsp:Transcript_70110/g.217462  ORF Transcript_70110/g.217462 Transcript_70110/m.217462 type:complete len:247 (+) Transcript_70110:1274-2014(+)
MGDRRGQVPHILPHVQAGNRRAILHVLRHGDVGAPRPAGPELPADAQARGRGDPQRPLEVGRLHAHPELGPDVAARLAEVHVALEGHGVEVDGGELHGAEEVVLLAVVLVPDLEEERVARRVAGDEALVVPHGVQVVPHGGRPEACLGLSWDLAGAVGVGQAQGLAPAGQPVGVAQPRGAEDLDAQEVAAAPAVAVARDEGHVAGLAQVPALPVEVAEAAEARQAPRRRRGPEGGDVEPQDWLRTI